MTDITIFPTDWRCEDVIPDKGESFFRINIFGKTAEGKTVCVQTKFTPYFLLEVPESWSPARTNLFITETAMKYDAIRPMCLSTKRKNMWGFDGGKMRNMVQFVFKTQAQLRKAKYRLKDQYQIYESSVDPIIRVFHLRNINPADWIRVSKAYPAQTRISNSDIEVETSFQHLGPVDDKTVPPLVIASWDIETYSKDRKFPLAENPTDYCIQIATTFQKYGEPEPYRRVVVCYKQTAPVEGVEIISCLEESDVMNTWMKILQDEKTDVSIGYNTWQYDLRYVHGRTQMCVDDMTGEDKVKLSNLGRLLSGGGEVVERDLSSNAFGQNKFFLLDMPGVMQIDLLQWFRKNRNLESYSLNNVSKLYLGDQKNDLPAMQIFEKFEGDSEDRAVIAAYAAKDTDLPLKLLKKMAILEDLTEMANAVKVPVDYINFRGQQIRAFSCLVGKARQMNYAIPDDKAWATEGKYEGATVLDAKKGAYFTPIAALDFASLYPSIIRAHNMSPETLVMEKRFENVPGVEYYEIETGLGKFKYAQKNDETGEGQGVVPALLDDLAKFRKLAKKHMAEAKRNGDDFKEALYDAQQRSFKVVMNSVYGFLGASKGFIPCVPIAASVTATGRKMIEHTAKRAVELLPGSEVIYGDTDSVMVKMKLPDDKVHDMDEQFKMAKWLAGEITKDFRAPNDLEFEKIYYPYILYSKKRYAAVKFEEPDETGKVDVKGLALVRRDFSPITREILKESLDTILYKKDTPTAVSETLERIRKVLDNEYPMEKFMMSKTLKTGYKNECQPHLTVANKIYERTGFPVPSGARVPFVYIEDKKNPDIKQSFKAEDPTFARDNDLVVDRLFYIEHQLRKPICSLFEPLLDDPDKEIFEHPSLKSKIDALKNIFKADLKTAKRVKKNIANNQREITSFFKKK
uniref:DNA polymerase n=24 Tax=Chlorovirus TaxID=181083 RepID=Q9YZZ9_9PHYC|nr:DNA polymerase [Paramecium bursaria Chlorella virus CVK2]